MIELEYPTLWNYPMSDFTMSYKPDGLMDATLAALETGVLTPLVKEELKYTIQTRRLAKGQSELGVEFSEPQQAELREDEKEKIARRREQNRLAAKRFRQRRKAKGPVYIKKIKELEVDNSKKIAELGELRRERDELMALLQNHLRVCPKQLQANQEIG